MVDQEVQVSVRYNVQYGGQTVPQLRAECGRRSLLSTGQKEEPMARLATDDHFLGPRHTGLRTPLNPYVQAQSVTPS